MKHRIATLAKAVCLTGALLASAGAHALSVGNEAPMTDRTMKAVSGDQVSVDSVRGPKGTVVVFWCNHCPFVKMWRSRLIDISNEYKDKGFGFLAVNSNDPKKYPTDNYQAMQQVAREYNYPFPYVVDTGSEMARAFSAARTPHVFVMNAQNVVTYIGAIDDHARNENQVKTPHLRNALDAMLEGKTPPKTHTKALGCSIKFAQ